MVKENDLLLKDLSSRLPYGVKVRCCTDFEYYDTELTTEQIYLLRNLDEDEFYCEPYLRPMQSMTEEEAAYVFKKVLGDCEILNVRVNEDGIEADVDDGVASYERKYIYYNDIVSSLDVFDYLTSRHLDYRGLVGKKLAIEAGEGMYKFSSDDHDGE